MSTIPDDNTFLANASRHQRKSTPKNRPFTIQGLLIAVALVFIASSFFIGNSDKPARIQRVEISTHNTTLSDSAPATTESTLTIDRDIVPAAKLPANLLEGDRARLLINTVWKDASPSTEDIYREAEALRLKQQNTDAWLLYFYAARQGYGAAAAALAAMSDPFTYTQFGTPLPNADEFQALKWYSMAKRQGFNDSDADFQRLKTHITNKARTGDTRSTQLLLQLENL